MNTNASLRGVGDSVKSEIHEHLGQIMNPEPHAL